MKRITEHRRIRSRCPMLSTYFGHLFSFSSPRHIQKPFTKKSSGSVIGSRFFEGYFWSSSFFRHPLTGIVAYFRHSTSWQALSSLNTYLFLELARVKVFELRLLPLISVTQVVHRCRVPTIADISRNSIHFRSFSSY